MVFLDYENRFRVWKDQVIPDRIDIINYENMDIMDYLTERDGERLFKRACKEYSEDQNYKLLLKRQNEISDMLKLYYQRTENLFEIY